MVVSGGYAIPDVLVYPDWLGRHVGDPDVLLIDTRPVEEYREGHISGAISVDVYPYHLRDTRPEPLKEYIDKMVALFAGCGLEPAKRVVTYEDLSGMRAARAFWLLDWLGHPYVSILDGGLGAWKARGGAVERSPVEPAPGEFRPRIRNDRLATATDVLARLGVPGVVLLDVRSDAEFLGKHRRAARGGAIPGAVHIEWLKNLTDGGEYLPAAPLEALYAPRGVTRDKEVITYCQGGFRSAQTYVALRLLGYPRVRNYLGSWGEWGNREDLPLVTPTEP